MTTCQNQIIRFLPDPLIQYVQDAPPMPGTRYGEELSRDGQGLKGRGEVLKTEKVQPTQNARRKRMKRS